VAKDQVNRFWWRSGSRYGSGSISWSGSADHDMDPDPYRGPDPDHDMDPDQMTIWIRIPGSRYGSGSISWSGSRSRYGSVSGPRYGPGSISWSGSGSGPQYRRKFVHVPAFLVYTLVIILFILFKVFIHNS